MTLPDTAVAGDSGHVADHNSIVSALAVVYEGSVETANSGSSKTLSDPLVYNIQDITLNASTPTITLPTATAGKQFTLILRQDGTGGRVPSWSGTVAWPGGAEPTLSSGVSEYDVISFLCVVDGTWLGFPAGYGMA